MSILASFDETTSARRKGATRPAWTLGSQRSWICWRLTIDHPRATETIPFRALGATAAIATFRPDLVLIYRKVGDDVLQLVRLGSHSELGL